MKNCSFINKPIIIFRGDDTSAFNLRTIKIILKGDLDLSDAIAKFTLLDYHKEWTVQEVASGELSMSFSSTDTKAMPLGEQTGTFRLYDMSTGEPRQLTIVNKIPFLVTNRVCELDNESYHADVSVASGEIISIEFNVGVGAVNGKADKVKDAVNGDLAGLDSEGNLTDSGIPASDVLRKSQMDATPTAGSLNPVTSDGVKQAIDVATPSDYEQVKAQVEANAQDIANIDDVIPPQATENNQLADKDFVNSSIATNTATFRGTYNLVSDLSLTTSATHEQVAAAIAAKLATLSITPENNDYCFVQVPRTDAEPTVIDRVDRYKCTVESGVSSWDYEWSLNNSSFTAEQWAAINSGITSALVTKLGALPTADELAASLLAKYEKPNTGIPKTDLSAGVQASLDKADSALQTTGDQTLNGTLSVKHTRIEEHKIVYDVDAAGESNLKFPVGQNDYLAVLSDIYAAVQQIAPAFTAKTYAANELCSYNGVVYRCKSSYTATVSSAKPNSDTTHWEAKKVSELFLPITGGTMEGSIRFRDGNFKEEYDSYRKWYLASLLGVLKLTSTDNNTILFPVASGTLALLSDTMRFSTAVSYAVGDVVFYNGAFYRCAIAHTAGAWNALHFAEVIGGLSAGTPTAPTPTAGDNSTKVATTAFVQGALPYAIASVPSGNALADRTVNVIDGTATAGITCSLPSQTANKSRDFYIAISCDPYPPTLTISNATLINAKGEPADLTLEAGTAQTPKTTVLRFTEVANGSTGVNPVFVVTGGANGGGSVDPATLNTKLDSEAAAPDYDSADTYAEGAYVTYLGKLYYAKQAITTPEAWTAAHWQETNMTTPDATLDITSQGSLRVVSAGGQTLWQQGYKLASASSATLSNEGVNIFTFAAVAAFDDTASYAIGDTVAYDGKAYTFTSAHSAGAWTGSDVELAAQSFSLPAAPTGKVGDFILEIDNTANASVAVAIDIAEYTNTTISLVIPDGAEIDDMTAIGGGVRCEFYFTQTAFNVNSKPTWKVVRQDVEVAA